MHGRVVDVDRGGTDAGTKVCMWKQKEEENENQLFWEDKYGNIRSKLNDMVLDTTGEIIIWVFVPGPVAEVETAIK